MHEPQQTPAATPPVDSPSAPPPAAVINSINEQKQAAAASEAATGENARKHPRHAWTVELTILVENPWIARADVCGVRVRTRDISCGGFSFVHRQMIHPGTRIRARFDSLPGCPMLVGTVCYCRHVGGTQHHIGVSFADQA